MSGIQDIRIAYEEWTAEPDSLPGWDIVPGIVNGIMEMTGPFKAWIYQYESKAGQYVKTEEFNDEDKQKFPGALKEYIRKNALCMISTIPDHPIEQLLSGYSKVSCGVIENDLRSEVFPAPVEAGDWIRIEGSNVVLIIYHDGDPLVVLRRSMN